VPDDLIAIPTMCSVFLLTLECGHVWVSDACLTVPGLSLCCTKCDSYIMAVVGCTLRDMPSRRAEAMVCQAA
jgi:hypothetical protein